MKLLVANIGGSTGYKLVLDRLQQLNTNQIPDIAIIQECGKIEKFQGLQPFFTVHSGTPQIRIHHNEFSDIKNLTIKKNLNIIHFTTTIKMKKINIKICFITAYRNHAIKPDYFFNNIDKIISGYHKTNHKICLSGDFNVTLENQSLVDLIDKYGLISKSHAKHKHRPNSNAYQIDHILSNINMDTIKVETRNSLEHISTINKTLGHPSFDITVEHTKQKSIPKQIKLTNWPNVIKKLDSTNPISKSQNFTELNNIDYLSSNIIDWVSKTIESESHFKAVNIQQKFNHKFLELPDTNPCPNNIIAWKNYYRTVNDLREGNCRFLKQIVKPSDFCTIQQKKLVDMPPDDHEQIAKHIDAVCGDGDFFSQQYTLKTTDKEVLNIIRNLNSSGAKDYNNQSTKEIKQLSKSKNFISWITFLWNSTVEAKEISQFLKRDNIIYIWKKKGCRADPTKYRPITLVTTISKIFEGLLNERLLNIIPNPASNFQHV